MGVSGGKGLGAFFSNANTFSELSGPFTTTQLTLLIVSLELSTSGDTFVFSTGFGAGLGIARFTTTTPAALTKDKNVLTHPALPAGSCDGAPGLAGRKDRVQQ